MKAITRALVMILILSTVFSIVSVPAHAAGFTTITSGETITLKTAGKCKYKFTLKDDSLLTISWTGNKKDNVWISFFTNKAMDKGERFLNCDGKVSGKSYAALTKGTYYVEMYDGAYSSDKPTTKVTFTMKAQSTVNKENWNKSRAIVLKENKWAPIMQTPNYDYNRWYKLKLTKAKKINVSVNTDYSSDIIDIRFFNSKMDVMDSALKYTSTGYKYSTEKVLSPGTYYFRVDSVGSFYEDGRQGAYFRVKWN